MRKYLEYFENEWPANITELTAVENKPFIGYLKGEGVQYTVIPKPQPDNEIWYTSVDGNIVTPEGGTDAFGANIESNTYEDGKGVIKFDNSVTSIGDGAFYGCYSLTSVTIPNSVTSIGIYAFDGCALTSIVIPDGVTSIRKYAFRGCSSLTSVTIPDSVTNIEGLVFEGCSSLPVENNLRYADTYLVEAVDKTLSTYSIKEGTKYIDANTFAYCPALTSITIPSSVIYIGDQAFEQCTSLTSVTIPNSVTTIRGGIFVGCSSLESVTLCDNIISLPDYKVSKRPVRYYGFFQNCSSLTSITFKGIVNKWNIIEKGQNWNSGCPEITVHCTDGDVIIPANQ